MKKMMIVLRHEFLQKVRSKAFIIMTLVGPLLMGAIVFLPAYLMSLNTGEMRTLAVVDSTGRLAGAMVAGSKEESPNALERRMSPKVTLESVSPGPGVIDSLARLVDEKLLTGYIVIPSRAITDSQSTAAIKLHNTSDYTSSSYLKEAYEQALRSEKLRAKGMDPKVVDEIGTGAKVETVKIAAGTEHKDNGGVGVAMAFITAFILYISMALYGAQIMNSVIEEKSSRVVELMASSVRPFELLVGKVLGVAGAGVIQVGVWSIMLILLSTVGLTAASAVLGEELLPNVSPFLFIYFIVFFVLGFLIYATLYAAVGSTAESPSDVQQVAFPITMLLVVPFMTLQGVIQNPSSSSSVILSLIPFFSPILMLGRIFTEMPPAWQIALSILLMIGTFFGALWVAARIYRVGILMYGKKFKLSEILRWIRYT